MLSIYSTLNSFVYTYLEPIFNLFGFYRIYSNDQYMNIPLDYYRRQIVKFSSIANRLTPYVKLYVKLKSNEDPIDATPLIQEFGHSICDLHYIEDIVFNDVIECLMVTTVSGERKCIYRLEK